MLTFLGAEHCPLVLGFGLNHACLKLCLLCLLHLGVEGRFGGDARESHLTLDKVVSHLFSPNAQAHRLYFYDRREGHSVPGGPHRWAYPPFARQGGTPTDILKRTTDHNFFKLITLLT